MLVPAPAALPRRARRGRFSTGLAARFAPKRFKRNLQDIARVFPEKSPQEVYEIAYNSWRNMGRFGRICETFFLFPEEFKKHVQIRGLEKMQEAEKNKTGGIIHIGHFTNWEAFGLATSVYGIDKAVLAQRVDNPYVTKKPTACAISSAAARFTAITTPTRFLPARAG